jgi:hypothetical protein
VAGAPGSSSWLGFLVRLAAGTSKGVERIVLPSAAGAKMARQWCVIFNQSGTDRMPLESADFVV